MQPVVYAQPQTVYVQQPVVYQQPVYHESNQEEALIAGMMIGGMMSRPMGPGMYGPRPGMYGPYGPHRPYGPRGGMGYRNGNAEVLCCCFIF